MAALIWVCLPLLPIAFFSKISNIDFGARRLGFIIPIYLLVTACGIVLLSDLVYRGMKKNIKSLTGWSLDLVITGSICILIISTVLHFYYIKLENLDTKRFARLLEKEAMANDLILAWRPEHYHYYYKGPNKILDVRRDLSHIHYLYNKSDRIWFLRPGNTREWNYMKPMESFMDNIGSLTFNFGGDLVVSFNRRVSRSHKKDFQERLQLIQQAIELKPDKPYLRMALQNLLYRQRFLEGRRTACP
jgi:hypothetical protein